MMELDQGDEVLFWPWPHLSHTPYGSRLGKTLTPAEVVEADHFGVAETLRNIRQNPRGYVRLRLRTLPHLFLSSFDSFTGIDRSFRQLLASRDVPHITVKFLMMAVFSVAPLILGVFGLPSIRRNSVALLCPPFGLLLCSSTCLCGLSQGSGSLRSRSSSSMPRAAWQSWLNRPGPPQPPPDLHLFPAGF